MCDRRIPAPSRTAHADGVHHTRIAVTGLKGPDRGVNSCGYERDPFFILAQASQSHRMQDKMIVVDLEDYMITYILVVRAN